MTNNFLNATSTTSNMHDYLKRPHIHNLLEESLKKPVTTIVAGAGYGKTQAVYSFLQEYDAVTVWRPLSTFDNLPVILWDNFVYAVSLQNKELGSHLKSLGVPETSDAFLRFIMLFSEEVKRGRKYVIVFDDFHLIQEKSALDVFENFIGAKIPNLSFVFIARSEPALKTIGLLSKGLLSTINEDDLRFSESEMLQYFQMQDLQLSPKMISDIYRYTDGWIFAIHIVELSLKKGQAHEYYALSAAKENIFRLLDCEVFSILSVELQNFLVQLSLIENLTLDLLKALSPNHMTLISEMQKISSFIRYDAFTNSYRIHHLFLNFLNEKQSILNADEKRSVYAIAANWCAKNGYMLDALSYYEKIEQYDEMVKIISSYYVLCPKDISLLIKDMLDRIPENVCEEKPIIQLLRIKFLCNCYQFEESTAESLKLIKKWSTIPSTPEMNAILGELYINLGLMDFYLCIHTAKYAFKEYFKKADAYLPNGSALIDDKFILNIGHYACSVGKSTKGEFDRFTSAMCYAMPFVSRVLHGAGYGTEYLTLAEKCYFQRDLKNAEKYAYEAIYKSQQKDQHDVEAIAIFYLVRISVSAGDYNKTKSLLNQLSDLAKRTNSFICHRMLDITEGWFYAQIGYPKKVASWISGDSESMKALKSISNNFFGFDRLIQIRYYLAEKKYYELLALLQKRENDYALDAYLVGSIEKTVLKAVALYRVNDKELAIAALQKAYHLAAPNGLDMPFIELGNHMRTLVDSAMRSENCDIPTDWLETIHTKSSAYAKKLANTAAAYEMLNPIENSNQSDLSKRELELLTDLCHGLTRKEIAENCNLSINTVKSMLQNIYSKIGAVNSSDAVRIAISSDLLKSK